MPRRRRHACEKRLYLLSAFSPAKAAGLRRLGGFHALRGSVNGIMRKLAYVEKIFAENKIKNDKYCKE